MPQRPFSLTPVTDAHGQFPVFAAIVTTTAAGLLLWFGANGEQVIGLEARGPFRLAGLLLGTLKGPIMILAAPVVAAVLTPGLSAAIPSTWQPVLKAGRYGGLLSLLIAGWPVIPALLASLLFLVVSPVSTFSAFVLAASGAVRLMIPGIVIGALLGRIWATRHAG